MPRIQHVGIAVTVVATVSIVAGAAHAIRPALLPTQQRVQAAGRQINLGLFPAGMAMSSDGRFLLVSNNGFLFESITVVDTETLKTADLRIGALGAGVLFIGVTLAPDGRTGYASGHGEDGSDLIYKVRIAPGPKLTLLDSIPFPAGAFAAGMAMSADGQRLFIAANLAGQLAVMDTATNAITTIPVGRLPWAVALHPTLPRAYVTNRADRTVSIVDTDVMASIGTVRTGSNPNAIAVSPDGGKVFVANANTDDLTVFDVTDPSTPRRIALAPFAGALPGSSPNALAFSPDGSRLYVANAWDNDLAVVDPVTEMPIGLVPTGWYPSAVLVSPDNAALYVANMKGARTFPRTRRVQSLDLQVNLQFGGTYAVHGTLQVLPPPDARSLGFLDTRVKNNNGFRSGVRPSSGPPADGPCSVIPCGPGDVSPIKHVVFIVRENKTYDEDLGDVPGADGDPKYLLYGQTVTPNLHALVQEFVLLDHFYADSEKSEPGHQWTTAAIDTDYVEKTWVSTSLANTRPNDIGVTDNGIRPIVPPISVPEGGYWFDNCFTHGVTFRNYGEFWRGDDNGNPLDYWVANTDVNFMPFNLDVSDQSRFDEWKREFDQQVLNNTFPQFTYLWLPNDHTKGIGGGAPDPRTFVADNDLATAKVVEAISNSPFWPATAIFLLEDDPQSGGDHIDSHRTVGTVIGPYVRRHYVSHSRFDMASMHRTMELILGLPPMSQFDQLAVPMRELFTDTPDTTPYTALPEQFPFTTVPANAPGAEISARLDWSHADRVPDKLLNRLLWTYLKGVGRDVH